MVSRRLLVTLTVLCVLAVASAWSDQAASYETYNPGGANPSCFQCHSGFEGRGPLHDLHVGSSQITPNCSLCHTAIGDDPKLDSSATDPNFGCNGCHSGVGLRAHHANANAPADAFGLFCVTCHPNDPAPVGENILPAFYTRTDVNVMNPCETDKTMGGEDWDGDGFGLDNDGDLVYDGADTDCQSVPVEPSTWGGIKILYN